MEKSRTSREEKCPSCEEQSYEWAIRPRIWNSDKCWNHMRSEERRNWLDEFRAHILENRGFRSYNNEMKYFKEVYLEKHFETHKYNYLKYLLKSNHYKHNKDFHNRNDISRELTSDEEAKIVDDLYNRYVYDLEHEERIYNVIGVDFANFDFSECNLSYSNFSEADLRGANFQKSILRNAIIDSALADGANFNNADISNTSAINTKLSSCSFLKAVVENCIFTNSILVGADFREARGSKTNFRHCDISHGVFISSRMPEANFENAKINNAIFEGAQLLKSVFEGCEAKESVFAQCNLEDAILARSNFEQSMFRNSNLAGANICDTIFIRADLSNSDMTRCKLNEDTDLAHSDLRDSNLKNVDLYMAKLDMTKVYYEDINEANLLTNQLKGDYFVMERKHKTRIFISYSHADMEFAHKLEKALIDKSIDVWIDRKEILVGDSLIQKIREGIDSSQYVCALLSKTSVESRWVQSELDIAMSQQIENQKIKVLPLVVEKDVELPGFLKGKLYIDFSSKENFAICVSQILRRVNSNK